MGIMKMKKSFLIVLWMTAVLTTVGFGQSAESVELRREGSVWEVTLTHQEVDRLSSRAVQRDLAKLAAPAVSQALQDGAEHLQLMDALGDNRGVQIVGIGSDPPVVVMPRGHSPYKNLLVLQAAVGGELMGSWDDLQTLAETMPLETRLRYLEKLEAVIPGRQGRRQKYRYGKLVANECKIGPWEKFNLLLLADNRVALQSHAGFLRHEPTQESQLRGDGKNLGPQEIWQLLPQDQGTVSLQSADGTFLHWGSLAYFEMDAASPGVTDHDLFMRNQEKFFLWPNQDGTVSLKLSDNRVSVSVVEWNIKRQGFGQNCRKWGSLKEPKSS